MVRNSQKFNDLFFQFIKILLQSYASVLSLTIFLLVKNIPSYWSEIFAIFLLVRNFYYLLPGMFNPNKTIFFHFFVLHTHNYIYFLLANQKESITEPFTIISQSESSYYYQPIRKQLLLMRRILEYGKLGRKSPMFIASYPAFPIHYLRILKTYE